jgi:hypothetical protein
MNFCLKYPKLVGITKISYPPTLVVTYVPKKDEANEKYFVCMYNT